MRTLTSNEDPEIRFYTICYDKTDLQRKQYKFYLKIMTYDLSIYTMDLPKFIVSRKKEESISA